MLALLLAGLAAVPAATPPGPVRAAHPNSNSRSTVRVEPPFVRVELVCQSRSLAEALEVDLDRDLRLSAEELGAGRGLIEGYLLERYALSAGGGENLAGRLEQLEAEPPPGPLAEEWIVARLAYGPADELDELVIQVGLFAEQNPFHYDVCELSFPGEAPASFLFGIDGDAWDVRSASARRPGVLGSFFRLGLEHIATGYDHLAFLAALLLASGRLRSLVGVVTAFTAAHSLTLALAALELVHVPALLVELSIAMSIAYVGALNLLVREPSSRWLEAFVFGLVHGLGFAGFVGEALRSEPLLLTALAGFNLGVEAGQLAALALLTLAIRLLRGDRGFDGQARAWLAPRWLRQAGSLAVAAAGTVWFLERAGWLGAAA